MVGEPKVLSSRRSYEYAVDSLRLTALTTPQVLGAIRGAFGFQSAVSGAPQPTFGLVPNTMPPGVACDWGSASLDTGEVVPIRFVHVEQRRIVIDVAGPSEWIHPVFERFRETIAGITIAGVTPIEGEPQLVRDYSEVTARLSFEPESILAPQLSDVLRTSFAKGGDVEGRILLPTLHWQMQARDADYIGLVPPVATFALRTGTDPSTRTYISSAFLDSAAHLAYLRVLEAAVAQKAPAPGAG